ncbi:unnamed protein product [Caenorhabditis auriculariae]|uniref:Uncharacterized protein n=1 Tax=Caenorhabditis auriculariae TaxID=2777116 RepID=A0A8S1HTD2_9PELO|nr:unnamed protein product [Caenorhabditis auriculariae]
MEDTDHDRNSDSDADFVDFEAQKATKLKNVKEMVECEIAFTVIRKRQRAQAAALIKRKKEELNTETNPDFVTRKGEIEKVAHSAYSEAKLKEFILNEQEDNKKFLQEQMTAEMEDKLGKKRERRRSVTSALRILAQVKYKEDEYLMKGSDLKDIAASRVAGAIIVEEPDDEINMMATYHGDPSTSQLSPEEQELRQELLFTEGDHGIIQNLDTRDPKIDIEAEIPAPDSPEDYVAYEGEQDSEYGAIEEVRSSEDVPQHLASTFQSTSTSSSSESPVPNSDDVIHSLEHNLQQQSVSV